MLYSEDSHRTEKRKSKIKGILLIRLNYYKIPFSQKMKLFIYLNLRNFKVI